MSLYNLKSLARGSYMIAKFSDDFEVESTYTLIARGFSYLCDCPANSRAVVTKPCRHKLMMPDLLPYADTEKFYDFDTKMFCTPLGDLLRPTADPEGRDSLPDVGEALRAEGEAPGLSIPAEAPGSSIEPPIVFSRKAVAADLAQPAPTIRRR